MGELYLREMDRTEDAAACFQRILELDPSHGIAQAALSELGLSSAGTDGETMLGVPTPIEEEDAAGALDQRPTLVHIPTGMDSAEDDDADEVLEDVAVIEETIAPEDRETEVSLEAYDDAGLADALTLGDEEPTPTAGDSDDDSEVGSLEDALDSLNLHGDEFGEDAVDEAEGVHESSAEGLAEADESDIEMSVDSEVEDASEGDAMGTSRNSSLLKTRVTPALQGRGLGGQCRCCGRRLR